MNSAAHRAHVNNPRGAGQAGLSLVEVLVSVTLSLILVAGVVQIFLSSKQSYNLQAGMARLQENARISMDFISRDLASTGYMGCLASVTRNPNVAVNVVNTLSNQSAAYDFATQITGAEGGANPDSITIRHAVNRISIPITAPMAGPTADVQLDATDPDYGSLHQYDILAIGDCTSAAVFMITNDPGTSGGVIQHATGVNSPSGQSNATSDLQHIFGAAINSQAQVLQVVSSSYSIGNCTDNPYPNCKALIGPGGEIAEGVEDMQILYGVPVGSNIKYVQADQLAASDWNQIVSVRVTLTVNTAQRVGAPGDGLARHSFTRTVRLRNRLVP